MRLAALILAHMRMACSCLYKLPAKIVGGGVNRNHLCLCGGTNCAGKGLYALCLAGGRGGDNAIIPGVLNNRARLIAAIHTQLGVAAFDLNPCTGVGVVKFGDTVHFAGIMIGRSHSIPMEISTTFRTSSMSFYSFRLTSWGKFRYIN